MWLPSGTPRSIPCLEGLKKGLLSGCGRRPCTLLEAFKKAQRLLLETAGSSAFANLLRASFEE